MSLKDGLDPGRGQNMNKELEVRENITHTQGSERNLGLLNLESHI